MIELPDRPAPNGVQCDLLDFGMTLRPATGAAVQRIDRKGSRWRAVLTFPPMQPAVSRIFVSRFVQAKSQGLRVALPLLEGQGSPGAPKVDGAGQAGSTLNIKGLTPGYALREGYWFSIEDALGQHYLHNCASNVRVGSDGFATIAIVPQLRVPFTDNATIHLGIPMLEGFVDGESWSWEVPVNRLIALQVPIEEAA